MTSEPIAVDEAKVFEFLGKALEDAAGTSATILASIGDRLGLFKDLAGNGPATSAQLAERTGMNERYAREWLGGMVTSGYLSYEPSTDVFSLPAEHEPVLARENGPYFFGGLYEMITALAGVLDPLEEAFRSGGGVPQSEYGDRAWAGMERFSAGMYENVLVQEFIPSIPEVEAALERGVDVADVGCGSGRGLVAMARAYPRSRFVGYDLFPAQLERAKRAIADAGLGERVRLELADASKSLPETYDVITTFDVVHDARDPLGLLTSIRNALRPDGFFVCLDINCSERLEENVGPLGTLFYGFSVLYCMTTSLAEGGEGLGTLGLHERKIRELAADAGFSEVERAPVDNPFNNIWVLRP